ncbi:M48 family metalloprotease [Micromonospora sp. 4G55]|uniref:M48 family metalloprotease n=1 Tax=Micromonospora sp. 4G55 TaxID=2806102 RepID=UPI0035C76621
MVVAAALVGLVYTLGRVLLEPWLLGVSGARQLSRREAERLRPILSGCAARLGLPSVPRLLIEDDPVLTNARAYARHIVVTTSLLDEPDEDVAALLSHELVHWRTGDEVTSAFVRGVGLPLVLVHAVPTWLMRRFPHPATDLLVFIVFWPVLLTMRFVVLPCHRRDVRAAEYRADAGAVLAGHAAGMRSMLERRRSFETGRSGWDEAVCATHPPSELRLDRLERLTPATADAATAADGRHADGRAWVLVEDEGKTVTVSVRDAGPGIGEGRLVEAARQGRLGMSQSIRGRIADLGGEVRIVSAPGEGTEVELVVPREDG